MLEIKKDLFSFIDDEETDAICITTNGITGLDKKAIMGAGTAGEAAKRWPDVRTILGEELLTIGNLPALIGVLDKNKKYHKPNEQIIEAKDYKSLIFSFPTKDDFRKPAIPKLIKRSALQLVIFADFFKLKKVVIPAPGVGSFTGKLNWEKDVKPLIKDILDDRFVISFLEPIALPIK